LVVEDERHIARYLQFVLAKEGFEVATAHDGEEALRRIGEYSPHAVLLDLVLPGMSGTDLLAAIRADYRFDHVVIIVLSARTSTDDTAFLARANVQAQCPKPVAPSTLLKKLAEFGVRPAPVTV
jgi:DNA-binding response OmpR family regulator